MGYGQSTATHLTIRCRCRKTESDAVRKYFEVFASTVYETEHPVVRVHPETGERTLVLGAFVRRLVGLPPADSAQTIFASAGSHHAPRAYGALEMGGRRRGYLGQPRHAASGGERLG